MATDGISIDSLRKPKVRRSDEDSKLNLRMFAMLAAVLICIYVAGRMIWKWDGNTPTLVQAQPAATENPVTVITETVILTPTPTIEPIVIEMPIMVEVTREVTITEYVNVPYEVTRVVEVLATPAPTLEPSPTPALAPGVVRVCVDASAVKELYIGGSGVVGGGCADLYVGQGATYIEVQVNR